MSKKLFIDCEHHDGVNIFEMLLSNLFSDFSDMLRDNRHSFHDRMGNNDIKRQFMLDFQTVQTALEVTTGQYDFQGCDTLEALAIKGSATNLYTDFNTLLLKYIDEVEPVEFIITNSSEKDYYFLKKYLERGQNGYDFSDVFSIQQRFPDTELHTKEKMMSMINSNNYRPSYR